MSDPFAELDNLDVDDDSSVGLGAEDKKHAKSNREEWFKGEAGCSYRVHLVHFWPLVRSTAAAAQATAKEKGEKLTKEQLQEVAKKALIKRAEELGKPVDQLLDHEKLDTREVRFNKILFHYKEGVGYAVSRLGMDGDAADEVWKMMGEQQKCFTTVALVYPTNREGEIDRDALTTKWRVLPWRLSPTNYAQFHEVASSLRANDLSIANQDVLLHYVKKKNFTVLDKMTGSGKAIFRANEKFMNKVLEKACLLYDKLQPFREISTSDLRLKLGLNDNKADDVSSDDMEDLLAKA